MGPAAEAQNANSCHIIWWALCALMSLHVSSYCVCARAVASAAEVVRVVSSTGGPWRCVVVLANSRQEHILGGEGGGLVEGREAVNHRNFVAACELCVRLVVGAHVQV